MDETPLLESHGPLVRSVLGLENTLSSASGEDGCHGNPAAPLYGLVVAVEVRAGAAGCENRGPAIAHQLSLLGASVARRLSREVTHLVFKDGRASVLARAGKLGVTVVSPLWLEACRREGDCVSEGDFPVRPNPDTLRGRRMRSMQPKPLLEEISKSVERSRKLRKSKTPIKGTPTRKTPVQQYNLVAGKGSSDKQVSPLGGAVLVGTTKAPRDPLISLPINNKQRKPLKKRAVRKAFEKQLPSLVLTSVPSQNRETVHSIIERLGRFRVVANVNQNTTHLVCGSPRRTVNILAATLRGCWVLSLDWVMRSMEAGQWLPEEGFEMSSSFSAAHHYRLLRESSWVTYSCPLFRDCGSILLAKETSPPNEQLEMLLALSGGKVTRSHRKAKICVGCVSWNNDAVSVSEQWILDSISAATALPTSDYFLGETPHPCETSPEL